MLAASKILLLLTTTIESVFLLGVSHTLLFSVLNPEVYHQFSLCPKVDICSGSYCCFIRHLSCWTKNANSFPAVGSSLDLSSVLSAGSCYIGYLCCVTISTNLAQINKIFISHSFRGQEPRMCLADLLCLRILYVKKRQPNTGWYCNTGLIKASRFASKLIYVATGSRSEFPAMSAPLRHGN